MPSSEAYEYRWGQYCEEIFLLAGIPAFIASKSSRRIDFQAFDTSKDHIRMVRSYMPSLERRSFEDHVDIKRLKVVAYFIEQEPPHVEITQELTESGKNSIIKIMYQATVPFWTTGITDLTVFNYDRKLLARSFDRHDIINF